MLRSSWSGGRHRRQYYQLKVQVGRWVQPTSGVLQSEMSRQFVRIFSDHVKQFPSRVSRVGRTPTVTKGDLS
ncbi:hypothetical protein Xph01_27210 [Micromonospora phaseoli]|nr:hypothetical protein Xph01_27210 [Micromonospora phaseoli]